MSFSIVGPIFQRVRRHEWLDTSVLPSKPALGTRSGFPKGGSSARESRDGTSNSLLHYNNIHHSNLRSLQNLASYSPLSGNGTLVGVGDAEYVNAKLLEMRRIARRREQCRINQARYRFRKEQRAQASHKTVLKLREEISQLELERSRLLSSVKQSVFDVVVEYFHHFRHGIESGQDSLAQDRQVQEKVRFLQSSMAPNLSLGECRGVDTLIDRWHRFSSYFEKLHFQLEHMREVAPSLVVVRASLAVTVTKTTLKCVFPHLLENDQDLKLTRVGAKLLGRRLQLPCSLWFEWDEGSNKVVRLETSVDILIPVKKVMKSVEDTALVLNQAMATGDSELDISLLCRKGTTGS
ncbi:hypothetical protein F441_21820 [Phytophthora nicotianae CJ01A1]|uniref:BZIP domain-containing protein n=3 Tax=Phytophthora nicotianae TaxID=4792 RepID=W2FNE5_PHYNI|nr:hypothetical protein L915_21332 [Phytophthora nicotianae]ETO59750.1 hypothetical protein F444_21956 [Phytophthora nicotianae P1976]ETP00840.1 hypothetical protein F441_21820 [Phytophthora nicotianae CJ01A1]ETL24865.1 hypothetical protein L916_21201 [Phytophthora nicotianae]ETL78080.1 hypothetical protein L917_21057 [Phytophthora nicotianae]